MTTILGASASGLMHNQRVLDVVAQNMANVDTAAYKRIRALGEGIPGSAVPAGSGRLGVGQTTADMIGRAGQMQITDDPLSFAIQDDAYYRLTDLNGDTVYSKFGQLAVDGANNVTDFRGRFLNPPVQLPEGAVSPKVDNFGFITVPGEDGNDVNVGRITVARFVNPQGLESIGDGLFIEGTNSGAVTLGQPGDERFAALLPGAIEGSNVEIEGEFTALVIAQRAYQASAQTFKIGDEMLEASTNLTR